MVDEEIRGAGSYDIHVTDIYVEVNNGTNRFRAILDKEGWLELQLVVTEVCAENGWL